MWAEGTQKSEECSSARLYKVLILPGRRHHIVSVVGRGEAVYCALEVSPIQPPASTGLKFSLMLLASEAERGLVATCSYFKTSLRYLPPSEIAGR